MSRRNRKARSEPAASPAGEEQSVGQRPNRVGLKVFCVLCFIFSSGALLALLLSIYWPWDWAIKKLYSFHMELTGLVFVLVVVVASCGGLGIVRLWGITAKLHKDDENDVVANLVTVAGIFFALVMAVIATGVWDNFRTVSEMVEQEARAAGTLYRSFDAYQDGKHFQDLLTAYIMHVVCVDWKAQNRGQTPPSDTETLNLLIQDVRNFRPKSEPEKMHYPDTLAAMERLLTGREARRDAVSRSLPTVLWFVVFSGAALNILMVFLLHTESAKLHFLLVAILGAIVGLVLFLVIAMDHPLWGELSVPSDAFQLLLQDWTGKTFQSLHDCPTP